MGNTFADGRRYSMVPIMLVFFLPFSCTQFFTTSLAPWAARDPSDLIPVVKASNVAALVDQTAGDPALSLEVLKGIESELVKAPPKDKPILQAAALGAAANASGIGPAIISTAGNITSSIGNEEEVKDILTQAIAGLGQLAEVSASLVAILPDPSDTVAFEAFVASSSPEDLASAAIVILAAEAEASGGVSGYLDTFNPGAPTNSPAVKLAVELAKAAAEGYRGSGPLADVLSAIGLTNP